MFNYKRISFILLILLAYFILTDTAFEKKLRVSSWALINVAADEGQQVTDSAPTSFIDTLEDGRKGLVNFFDTSKNKVNKINEPLIGIKGIPLSVVSLVLNILTYLCGYVITFYPLVVLILYYFLTSRIFKKDEFAL